MRKFYYYIIEDSGTLHPQDLKLGVRILKLSETPNFIEKTEGPFSCLDSLKKKSIILKKLRKENPRRAQQILQPARIPKIIDFIITNPDANFPPDFIQVMTHIMQGEIIRGVAKGVHWYNEKG